ncbi:hypothetical protein HanXRQr2_Chr16g0767031 [Helianthus annuus]|uniref:Uncharacterized protein n=1 Tax=Helianthus annuus TaxID=4232 RepID=A0A9K3H1U8_HELAN|nr:hypothetical protein HanXRQr2_Chr16g0767031 [Helianthus annuus]
MCFCYVVFGRKLCVVRHQATGHLISIGTKHPSPTALGGGGGGGNAHEKGVSGVMCWNGDVLKERGRQTITHF